ncbi:hypothetical protein HYALB_00007383 [Hymenoscyphus albidus]|uniref:Uncharacterized protein n=1 Tax=Hymenoscyphus albidus TaxID=595503 RepID=A0A9N9PZT2_9HELO|nr:hypothetical protein HYALB_00007383 [Hymenoscyphus albidus]
MQRTVQSAKWKSSPKTQKGRIARVRRMLSLTIPKKTEAVYITPEPDQANANPVNRSPPLLSIPLRSHSTPIPVHSVFSASWRFASSNAVPAKAKACLVRHGGGVDQVGREGTGGPPGFEPVTAEIEEAVIGPVAGGGEEYHEEKGAVYTWSVEEVGAHEKEEDEYGGGICGDE